MDGGYEEFADAYYNLDIQKLSDEQLRNYRNMCNNGYTESLEEIWKRKAKQNTDI